MRPLNEQEQRALVQGLDAYLQHVRQCKTESKRLIPLLRFFSLYDPKTLRPAAGAPPLRWFVRRYYRARKERKGGDRNGTARRGSGS